MQCKICNRKFNSMQALSLHVRKSHNMSPKEYKIKYDLYTPRYCEICSKEIAHSNKTPRCNHCRDRNGINNPFFNKKHTKETVQKIKDKNSIKSKERWKNEEYREKVIISISKPRNEEFKKRHSETMKQMYINKPEQRALRSAAMKRSWANGNITKNNYSCNASSLEKQLLKDIQENIACEALENQTIHIGSKWYFPDIIINNKYIIEFYGDYWHANPLLFTSTDIIVTDTAENIWKKDNQRLHDLMSAKYIIFVIWENDYINTKEKIINTLDSYLNWDEEPDDPCVIFL